MPLEMGKTYIGKVRVQGQTGDSLALQLRLTQSLSVMHLRPPGLAPAAVLCVRRVRVPQRSSVVLPRHGFTSSPAWEQTIVASLARLVPHAARPAREAVPAHAEAVLFADYAELLACLAADWCAGNIATHWWWQNLCKGTEVTQVVLRTWLEAPAYVPAALQHLAGRGIVVPFVRAVGTDVARALLHNMTQHFALPEIQAALDTLLAASPQHVGGAGSPAQTAARSLPSDTPSTGRPVMPPIPWHAWVPESTTGALAIEQQCVLGIGLMLQRAPTALRAPSFALAVRRWYQAIQDAPSRANAVRASVEGASVSTPAREEHGAQSAAPPLALDRLEGGTTHTSSEPGDTISSLEQRETSTGPGGSAHRHHEFAQAASTSSLPAASTEPVLPRLAPPGTMSRDRTADLFTPGAETVPFPTAPGQAPEPMPVWDVVIDTAFGGGFYLINLGLFLHIYGDFTTPAQPGISLPIWDFLALLGQRLVGDQMHADPLWPLLARLAGRSAQDAPGEDFAPPDVWRLPAEWLTPFPAGVWRWDDAHGRLRVQHPEDFCVLDVPLLAGDANQQLTQALQAYDVQTAVALHHDTLPEGSYATPLERWLGWLMPYVQARLQRALGLAHADEVGGLLCAHQARVYVTATHLDIALALETLPIAIRLAGLDRDPGWVPAAGRSIAFHFA